MLNKLRMSYSFKKHKMHGFIIKFVIIFLFTTIASTTTILSPPSAISQEYWKEELRLQIMKWRFCEMIYLTNAKSQQEDGQQEITGRAHCNDGRSFDFKGKGDLPEFEFFSCQPVRC